MNAPELNTNSVIEWFREAGKTCERILARGVTETQEEAYVVIDIFDKHAWPIRRSRKEILDAVNLGDARVVPALQGDLRILPNDCISDKMGPHQERNFKLIESLIENTAIFDSQGRGKLIAARAKETSRTVTEINKYLRRYWQGGQTPNTCVPLYFLAGDKAREVGKEPGKKRGPKAKDENGNTRPGIAIGEKERALLVKGLKLFYIGEKLSLPKAFRKTLRECFNVAYDGKKPVLPTEQPTLRQFKYVYQKEYRKDPKPFIISRAGRIKFNQSHRTRKGSLTLMTFGSGEQYEIDAQIADIELVDAIGRPIGRPTIYLVVDVFSHAVVGLAVLLERDNYIGAAVALECAFTDKVAFCAKYGIMIDQKDWPMHYICQRIKADRGPLVSRNADALTKGLHISLDTLPGYRPDWKGIIESLFKRLNVRTVHYLKGAVKGKKERGQRNPRLDACLTLHEFTAIVIHTVLQFLKDPLDFYDFSKFAVADDVVPRPLDLWQWGMENRTAQLREMPTEEIRSNLLPTDKGMIGIDGLTRDGLLFTLPESFENLQLFAGERGLVDVDVAYDPRLVDAVFLRSKGSTRLILCPLHERYSQYKGWSWFEVDEYRKAYKRMVETAKQEAQGEQHKQEHAIENIVELAHERQQQLRDPDESVTAFLRGVGDNRKHARREVNGQSAWTATPKANGSNSAPTLLGKSAAPEAVSAPESDESSPQDDTEATARRLEQQWNSTKKH